METETKKVLTNVEKGTELKSVWYFRDLMQNIFVWGPGWELVGDWMTD